VRLLKRASERDTVCGTERQKKDKIRRERERRWIEEGGSWGGVCGKRGDCQAQSVRHSRLGRVEITRDLKNVGLPSELGGGGT